MTANHYDALGVPKDADAATIKRAYRRKSRKHHPDRQGGDHQAMVTLNRAFDTLSDPEKRARYDKTGEDAPRTPTLDERAREILMRLLDECVEKLPETVDVVQVMRDSLAKAKTNGQNMRMQLNAKISSLEAKRARIKYKGRSRNFLADFLDTRIANLRETFEKIEDADALNARASEMLKDFDWQHDQQDSRFEYLMPAFRFTP